MTACSGVNLRMGVSTTRGIKTTLASGTKVTVASTAAGGSWTLTCAGQTVSGSKWYRITAINGKSTMSLYGLNSLYAATGSFKPVPTTPPPPPPPPPAGPRGDRRQPLAGRITWSKVGAAGKRFAFIKANEAADYVDDQYLKIGRRRRRSGCMIGAYHFAQPDLAPTTPSPKPTTSWPPVQLGVGDLVPGLDLEVTGGLNVPGAPGLGPRVHGTGLVSDGRPAAIIYIRPAFWAKYVGDTTWFADTATRPSGSPTGRRPTSPPSRRQLGRTGLDVLAVLNERVRARDRRSRRPRSLRWQRIRGRPHPVGLGASGRRRARLGS